MFKSNFILNASTTNFVIPNTANIFDKELRCYEVSCINDNIEIYVGNLVFNCYKNGNNDQIIS